MVRARVQNQKLSWCPCLLSDCLRQPLPSSPHLLTVLGGSTGQGKSHVGRGHHRILRDVHGPHQVVHIEKRVKFGHSLEGDDLRRDAYNTATEHKGTMTLTGPPAEVSVTAKPGQASSLIRTSALN